MGLKRVIGSGIVGMLLLILMAWISFRFLNLAEGVTGGLIQNIDDALSLVTGLIPGPLGVVIEVLAGAFIGLALLFIFPIHWCITYRPDDVGLLIAVTVPWILCCVITSALFAKSPRGGIHTSLAIGIGYAILLVIIYFIASLLGPFSAILDGLMLGLTDLPYLLAVLTSVLEGTLVGAVFAGFIGSLKYNPGKKSKKSKRKEVTELSEANIAIESAVSGQEITCSNCGAKITTDDLFCTNCGAKKPKI
ncbi:MAG: zinc ribbon domain-containing protein [Promethearchaeota archaeon]|jgi:hypothetical protein